MRSRYVAATLAAVAIGVTGCGSSATSTSPKPTGFAALTGKRLSGAPSSWLPIANPYTHPANVGGTVVPPVEAWGTGADGVASDSVVFFAFANAADASAFYNNPPLGARIEAVGILAYQPLSGNTGIPAPSRGLDLRSCLWSGGPGQGGTAGKGASSGGNLQTSGQCSVGTASSIGIATIFQRGSVVVIVSSVDTTVIGGSADPSELSQNAALEISALQLMQTVGLVSTAPTSLPTAK